MITLKDAIERYPDKTVISLWAGLPLLAKQIAISKPGVPLLRLRANKKIPVGLKAFEARCGEARSKGIANCPLAGDFDLVIAIFPIRDGITQTLTRSIHQKITKVRTWKVAAWPSDNHLNPIATSTVTDLPVGCGAFERIENAHLFKILSLLHFITM